MGTHSTAEEAAACRGRIIKELSDRVSKMTPEERAAWQQKMLDAGKGVSFDA
jgi:hypothetical protein